MKLSSIYGKEVESTDKGRRGWVRGVCGFGGAPQFLQCFDEEEREFDIDIKNVVAFGEKIIFEDRAAARSKSRNMRLGVAAYSEYGNFLGHLTEIVTDRGGGVRYVIGKKSYRPEDVTTGDVMIVHPPRTLKDNVLTEDGAVVLKKGTALTGEALKKAEAAGEYFQARMKTI